MVPERLLFKKVLFQDGSLIRYAMNYDNMKIYAFIFIFLDTYNLTLCIFHLLINIDQSGNPGYIDRNDY